MSDTTYTAFSGSQHLTTAPLPELLRALKTHHDQHGPDFLIFEDQSGRQVDFDWRGSVDDVLTRHLPPPVRKGPGRPKLGVTAREVTLLPRHWEWLDSQGGGASAALRRIVDLARKHDSDRQQARRAAEATERFLMAVAGNEPHFEDVTRALYAGDAARFTTLTANYPSDVRAHALRLAQPAFDGNRA